MKPAKYAAERKYKYGKHKAEGAPLRVSLHTCETCGKQCFASNRVAKAAAARLYPGSPMRTYQCGGFWHITSVPAARMAVYRERDFRRAQREADG